ncbi:MAG TPA: hypothetical protein VGR23_01330 [Candidatus Dormibacteraeota bacterium]|jgi:hypothetical protein|nr:hypothetical protein [Candidatus Dormibacteraeota bacterium]
MHRFAGLAVKTIGAVAATAVLSAGVVSAASPSPNPSSSAAAQQQADARHHDWRAIRRAVIEAEADVLGIAPEALVKTLKEGKTVSELAQAKGLTKAQFITRLLVDLSVRLDNLVDRKVITPAQEKKVLAWIADGHVPFWDGIHPRK